MYNKQIIAIFLIIGCIASTESFTKTKYLRQKRFWSKKALTQSPKIINAKHAGSVSEECLKALTNPNLAAGEMVLSSATVDGMTQFEMATYFNNDMSVCSEDTGIETRIYMTNIGTLTTRLDDCLDGYPEDSDNGDKWKLIPQVCDDEEFCGAKDLGDEGINWFSEPSMENIHLGYKYKNMIWFMQPHLLALVQDGWMVENDGPIETDGSTTPNYVELTIPLVMQWWYASYEELSNYMNFEFTIRTFTSVDPARTSQIEMVAVEVKADPCDDCIISKKASAAAYFVQSDSDWSVLKTDFKYDTNSPAYIKFKLKNAADWVGKGLEMLQFDYMKRNKAYPLWLQGEDVDGRFPVTIVDKWDAETGEVRLIIPALTLGHGVKVCFQGQFKLVSVSDNGGFADLSAGDIPCAQGGLMDCDERRFAYRGAGATGKGGRRLQEDNTVVQKYNSKELQTGDSAPAPGGQSASGSPMWMWVLIFVLIVAVIGAGAAVAMAGGSKSEFLEEKEYGMFE